MKTAQVIGRKIVEVKQYRAARGGYAVEYIKLDNGIRLFPFTLEREDGYDTTLVVNKVEMRRSKKTW